VELTHGPADDGNLLRTELAAHEGGHGARQMLQLAGGPELSVRSVGSQVQLLLQPVDAAGVEMGRSFLLPAIELGQPVRAHRLHRTLDPGEPLQIVSQ